LCGRIQFNDHPSAKHPGPHGQPVVATAIAKVEFEESRYAISAYLRGYLIAVYGKPLAEWLTQGWKMRTADKFCAETGFRIPTADQLEIMYEAWKKEQEAKG
jgi:hypothetical protein